MALKLVYNFDTDALDYIDVSDLSAYFKLDQTTPQTVSGTPVFNGGLLAGDKIKFTQTDGNEYIDSLADGYMDYGATTEHRFKIGANQEVGIKNDRCWFDSYCWFGGTDTGIGYDSNWKCTFAGVSNSYGYIARFRSVGSNDNALFSISTANNSNGCNVGCAIDSGQPYGYIDSQTAGGNGQIRFLQNGNLTTIKSLKHDLSSVGDNPHLKVTVTSGTPGENPSGYFQIEDADGNAKLVPFYDYTPPCDCECDCDCDCAECDCAECDCDCAECDCAECDCAECDCGE